MIHFKKFHFSAVVKLALASFFKILLIVPFAPAIVLQFLIVFRNNSVDLNRKNDFLKFQNRCNFCEVASQVVKKKTF